MHAVDLTFFFFLKLYHLYFFVSIKKTIIVKLSLTFLVFILYIYIFLDIFVSSPSPTATTQVYFPRT